MIDASQPVDSDFSDGDGASVSVGRTPAMPCALMQKLALVARYDSAVVRYLQVTAGSAAIASQSRDLRGAAKRLRDELATQRAVLILAVEGQAVAHSTLREELAHYVRRLKADGLAAEQVLAVVNEGVLASAREGAAKRDVEQLAIHAARWTIDVYYEAA